MQGPAGERGEQGPPGPTGFQVSLFEISFQYKPSKGFWAVIILNKTNLIK